MGGYTLPRKHFAEVKCTVRESIVGTLEIGAFKLLFQVTTSVVLGESKKPQCDFRGYQLWSRCSDASFQLKLQNKNWPPQLDADSGIQNLWKLSFQPTGLSFTAMSARFQYPVAGDVLCSNTTQPKKHNAGMEWRKPKTWLLIRNALASTPKITNIRNVFTTPCFGNTVHSGN